jgi:hypothetical protein
MADTDPERRAQDAALPGGDFRLFVQKLGYQALISLGILDNPLTQTRQANVDQARGVIDDILMLREKTRGNLEADEEAHLADVIVNLERHMAALSDRPERSKGTGRRTS